MSKKYRRGMGSPTGRRDDLRDAYEALMRNDPAEAVLVLHAILFPRFKSPADALTKLQAHKGGDAMTPFLRTASGRDLILARPDAVAIEDIALRLAKINRFNGATRQPYSVAQHSVLVARILALAGHDAATQLWGLLHDAHEAYLGDMATPVQWHLFGNVEKARNVLASPWEEATNAMDEAIVAAFGLTVTTVMRREVVMADKRALVTEWRDLMPGPCPSGWTAEPVPDLVCPAPHWTDAQAVFLQRFDALTGITATEALR